MGQRGPQRTPTKTLKIRGSWRANEPERKQEVQPETSMPGMPEWLSPPARRIWLRVAPVLARTGLLTELDGNTLARYCEAEAQYIQAKRYVDSLIKGTGDSVYESRLLIRTRNGNVIQNPAISLMKNASAEADRLGKQFGMSPSARAGLSISPVAKPAKQGSRKKSPFNVA